MSRPTLGLLVLVTSNLPPVRGGSAVVYDNLARHAGGRAIVVAPTRSYEDGLPLIGWREHDRHAGYPIVRLPLLRTRLDGGGGAGRLPLAASDLLIRLRLVAVLLRLMLTRKVRAICVGELLAGHWLLRLFGCLPWMRTLAYVHGEEITISDGYNAGLGRGRAALRAADRVVVVSGFTYRQAEALLCDAARKAPCAAPRVSGRLRLIENGVDTRRFRVVPRDPRLVELHGLRGAFVFVAVCRLLAKKGIDRAILALAEILPRRPRCRLLVVGTGPYRDHLEQLARDSGVACEVVFAGQVADDDLVAYYALGDVFVMPNRRLPNGDTEGFGLVFLEANASGLPVIAGRDGGSTDAVRDGVNGLVVDGNAVSEIAAAMSRLHDDAPMRARLREGGLRAAAAADWRGKAALFVEACLG